MFLLNCPACLAMCVQMVNIVSTQLDEWVEAGSIDLTHEGKALSFEFSTQLLVSHVTQDLGLGNVP